MRLDRLAAPSIDIRRATSENAGRVEWFSTLSTGRPNRTADRRPAGHDVPVAPAQTLKNRGNLS
jgi:hypothetical protein